MIDVSLCQKSLWQKFAQLANEMIITKRGRNMFPILQYKLAGLEEDSLYQCSLVLRLCDDKKYRFINGHWDRFEPCVEATHYPREVFSSDPRTGKDIMKRGISFDKLKLTNSDDVSCPPHREIVRVQSMRKYSPILIIYKISTSHTPIRIAHFEFEETQFIAVTAYQNTAVKDLKVMNNKYAQGFRENVQKRPSTSPQSYVTEDSLSPPVQKKAREDATVATYQPFIPQPVFDASSSMLTPYFGAYPGWQPAYNEQYGFDYFNYYQPWTNNY